MKESRGKYCVGDSVTLADIFLIPQFYNAERFEVDLSKFPNLNEIRANCESMAEFKNADPST